MKNVQTVASDNIYCNFTENSMELHVKDLENKDYVLVINKLLNHVNVMASHWKQKTGKYKNYTDMHLNFAVE